MICVYTLQKCFAEVGDWKAKAECLNKIGLWIVHWLERVLPTVLTDFYRFHLRINVFRAKHGITAKQNGNKDSSRLEYYPYDLVHPLLTFSRPGLRPLVISRMFSELQKGLY